MAVRMPPCLDATEPTSGWPRSRCVGTAAGGGPVCQSGDGGSIAVQLVMRLRKTPTDREGQTNRRTDRQKSRQQTDRRTDGQTDRRTDEQTITYGQPTYGGRCEGLRS